MSRMPATRLVHSRPAPIEGEYFVPGIAELLIRVPVPAGMTLNPVQCHNPPAQRNTVRPPMPIVQAIAVRSLIRFDQRSGQSVSLQVQRTEFCRTPVAPNTPPYIL